MSVSDLRGKRWLLPEGIEEWLPPDASALELLRQNILELYHRHGYDLIMTPMVEYLDSLLSGIGNELELETFKVADNRSGRMLGLRADITPQSARVDAHRLLKRNASRPSTVNRLCYVGPVLNAVAADGRCLHQTGAELYGHSGIASDAEVLLLMWEVVRQSGVVDAVLDIGHVGIFNYLVEDSGLDIMAVRKVMRRRASDDLRAIFSTGGASSRQHLQHMQLLLELHGGIDVLDEAAREFRSDRKLMACIRELRQLVDLCLQNDIDVASLHIDLAELRGSRYHNGVVFAAYHADDANAIARGGRYDHIGRVFGRARRSTGFSAFLETLFLAANDSSTALPGRGAILAPWPGDSSLSGKIRKLRQQGETVINRLGVEDDGNDWSQCDRELVKSNRGWKVVRRTVPAKKQSSATRKKSANRK